MKALLLSAFLALVSGKPASDDVSLVSEPVPDLTSGDAPAYWSAECGGRTYVGSYTLMMDWAQCRDYCTYFPHAAELGHTFSFADILDADSMECLRYNMNNQYTPGNGYDGHYWAGGYRGGDGQYRWDSGAVFEFNDFVGNPGEDPYLHLTPGNNYQWNTKNDQNDRNNGCLCKSSETVEEKAIAKSECPGGWADVGSKCVLIVMGAGTGRPWEESAEFCKNMGGELVSWADESGYFPVKFLLSEACRDDRTNEHKCSNWFWTGAKFNEELKIWMWEDKPDLVPMNFGWFPGQPNENDFLGLFMGGDATEMLTRDMFGSGSGGSGYQPICQIVK